MILCVILHNMITEEEGMTICMYSSNNILHPHALIQVDSPTYFTRLLPIQNRETHHNLRDDLTKHIQKNQFKQNNNNVDDDEDDE